MKRIEDIIKENKDAFNDKEPETKHFEKFNDKLQKFQIEKKESFYERYNIVLKIAAAVILFITISTLYLSDSFVFLKQTITEHIVAAELPDEVQEVMLYYNIITDKKISRIDQLAVSEDEAKRIKDMAILEINNLEGERLELEEEYAKNPNSKRILDALLVNHQKKSKILDKIIYSLTK